MANKNGSQKKQSDTTSCNRHARIHTQKNTLSFQRTLITMVPPSTPRNVRVTTSSDKRKIALTNRLVMASTQEACEAVTQLRYLSSLDLLPYLQQSPSRTKMHESRSHSRNWMKCWPLCFRHCCFELDSLSKRDGAQRKVHSSGGRVVLGGLWEGVLDS